jgi:hypothetical protein
MLKLLMKVSAISRDGGSDGESPWCAAGGGAGAAFGGLSAAGDGAWMSNGRNIMHWFYRVRPDQSRFKWVIGVLLRVRRADEEAREEDVAMGLMTCTGSGGNADTINSIISSLGGPGWHRTTHDFPEVPVVSESSR